MALAAGTRSGCVVCMLTVDYRGTVHATGYQKIDLQEVHENHEAGQYRVTTCLENLENLEMSGNLKHVREMSGIMLTVRELSGKSQGKIIVRENWPDWGSNGKIF